MGWWDRFRRYLSLGRTTPEDPYRRILGYLPVQHLPAGIHLDMDSALQISAVWACIDVISKALASSPCLVQTRDPSGRRQTLATDPLAYLLNVRPNADMTAIGLREAMLISALSWGNGYAEIVRDLSGRISELQFLLPDRMTPKRLGRETGYRLVYEYKNPMGDDVTLEGRDVFHLRGPGCTGILGDNMIARAVMAISVAAAQERFAATYFGNNTVIGGILEYPGKLGDEAYKNIKDSWEKRHKGPNKAHQVAILEAGTTYKQLETSAESSQLIQSRVFQLQEIARYYGVPLHKIGDNSRATFNNIEHQSIEWVRDGLSPWARRFEQEADYKLFAARSMARSIKIDTAWLSHGDAKSRADFYKVMRELGVYSVNEIREKEGENDIGPDGDVRIVPLNMQTLEQLELTEQKAQLELDTMQIVPDPEEEPDDPPDTAPEQDDPYVANRAIAALFESVLDRYDGRIRNRTAELVRRRKPIEGPLGEFRSQLRLWLAGQAERAAIALGRPTDEVLPALLRAAESVDGGASPDQAAEMIVAHLAMKRIAA